MKFAFWHTAIARILVVSAVAVVPVNAIAQDEGSNMPSPKSESGYMVAPYRNYAEFALDMILDRIQGRALGVSVDADEYIIGSGDQFGVYFVAGNINDLLCRVSVDGKLFVKSVGPIEVAGVTLREGVQRIKDAVRKSYSGTGFDVQLIDFRFVQINVIGEVSRPGIYYAPAIWRVSEIIELAGGLSPEASSRKIVLQGNQEEYAVDLVRFRATGARETNPFICKGNTVIVPGRRLSDDYVSITGLVNRPGIFSFVADDCLGDFMAYVHGAKGDLADMLILLSSRDGEVSNQLDGADLAALDFIPEAGDNITLVWKEGKRAFGTVTILGEVARPGIYPISNEHFSLKDLLATCGGVTAEGNSNMVQIYRPIKTQANGSRFNGSGFNLSPSNLQYPVGGGSSAYHYHLVSNDPRHPIDHSQLTLTHGDSLYVPRTTGMVSVTGAVASPGLIRFRKGMDVEYYLAQAGGLGFDADKDRMVIINPVTGGGINADNADELFDGETLFVPRKENGTNP